MFLDFGCIEALTPHVARWARAAHRAALAKNEPDSTLLLNRFHVGFFSVLARLDAVADYAVEERSFLTRLEEIDPPTFA